MGDRAPWIPPSIDDVCPFRQTRGQSYRAVARANPGFLAWVAKTIPGTKGRLAAEALATALGIVDEAA